MHLRLKLTVIYEKSLQRFTLLNSIARKGENYSFYFDQNK